MRNHIAELTHTLDEIGIYPPSTVHLYFPPSIDILHFYPSMTAHIVTPIHTLISVILFSKLLLVLLSGGI